MKERDKRKLKKGKVMLITGITLILLALMSVAGIYSYIYYTNRVASQAQAQLIQEFEDAPPPPRKVLQPGDVVGIIKIPKLGLEAAMVELASLDDTENLKRGPGHLPMTAYPGAPGNTVIAGHRTTYGAPFKFINELAFGDQIILETAEGTFTYQVYETRIVLPTDLTVLDQSGEPKVSLAACHPWYSAAQRIIVTGRLVTSGGLPLQQD
jgi:sortase A